jgi:BirA family biotin operon repressor/biotin-[acetyl-CoA-carboxylase] ligase
MLLDAAAMGIPAANWPQLSLTTAVAVCDALQKELDTVLQRAGSSPTPAGLEDEPARSIDTPRIGIKWPNDVMLDGRKICGILIESPGGAAPAKDRLIFGIGINVNNSLRLTPQNAATNGIAMCDVIGVEHDLQSVLTDFINHWRKRLDQLGSNDPQLAADWQQLCTLTGQIVRIVNGAQHTEGECLGTTSEGALVLQTTTGRQCVSSGRVSMVTRTIK